MMNSTTRLSALIRQLMKWASVKRLDVPRINEKPSAEIGGDTPPIISDIWLDQGHRWLDHFPDTDVSRVWGSWTGQDLRPGSYIIVCKGTLFRYAHPPRTFEEVLNEDGVGDA